MTSTRSPLFLALALAPALAAAQTSRPASRPAGPETTSKEGRLLVSLATENRRQWEIHLIDVATGKRRRLLGGPKQQVAALAASPSGQTMVVVDSKNKEVSIRRIDAPDKVLHSYPRNFIWPTFVDEQTLVAAERVKGSADGTKMRLVQLSVKTGAATELAAFSESVWDDIPLTLSPDRRRLVYFKRGPQRGLFQYDLKTRQDSSLYPGGTMVYWSPDSRHVFVFDKKQRRLVQARINPKGGVTRVKDFGEGSMVGVPLGGSSLFVVRFPNKKNDQRGLDGVHLDLQTGKETLLSRAIPLHDFVLLKGITPLRTSGSFAWVEEEGETLKVIKGRLTRGKVEKEDLLSGVKMVALLHSIP